MSQGAELQGKADEEKCCSCSLRMRGTSPFMLLFISAISCFLILKIISSVSEHWKNSVEISPKCSSSLLTVIVLNDCSSSLEFKAVPVQICIKSI